LPPLAAVTSTEMVQKLLAGIEPPVKVTEATPVVTTPPQLEEPTPAINTPLGNVSVNGLVRVAAVVFALLKVRVRVDVPLAGIIGGPKVLLMVGGTGTTGGRHVEAVTTFVSRVTAPFCASALPNRVAFVVSVTLARARIFPIKVEPVPIVAELPTCQNTLQL
jgi:hypothetical protein